MTKGYSFKFLEIKEEINENFRKRLNQGFRIRMPWRSRKKHVRNYVQ